MSTLSLRTPGRINRYTGYGNVARTIYRHRGTLGSAYRYGRRAVPSARSALYRARRWYRTRTQRRNRKRKRFRRGAISTFRGLRGIKKKQAISTHLTGNTQASVGINWSTDGTRKPLDRQVIVIQGNHPEPLKHGSNIADGTTLDEHAEHYIAFKLKESRGYPMNQTMKYYNNGSIIGCQSTAHIKYSSGKPGDIGNNDSAANNADNPATMDVPINIVAFQFNEEDMREFMSIVENPNNHEDATESTSAAERYTDQLVFDRIIRERYKKVPRQIHKTKRSCALAARGSTKRMLNLGRGEVAKHITEEAEEIDEEEKKNIFHMGVTSDGLPADSPTVLTTEPAEEWYQVYCIYISPSAYNYFNVGLSGTGVTPEDLHHPMQGETSLTSYLDVSVNVKQSMLVGDVNKDNIGISLGSQIVT